MINCTLPALAGKFVGTKSVLANKACMNSFSLEGDSSFRINIISVNASSCSIFFCCFSSLVLLFIPFCGVSCSLFSLADVGGVMNASSSCCSSGHSTLTTSSQNSKHGMPSNRTAASNAIISDSVDECETAPCFLHIHVIGTHVFSPTKHRYAPVVDLESPRSPAKLASQNNANQHLSGESPT